MKNFSRFLAVMLVVAMFSAFTVPVLADTKISDAQITETLGMLRGDGEGVTEQYLASRPNRLQAAIMYLRMMGLEDQALAYQGTVNFDDVGQISWAGGRNILAYLYANPQLGWQGDGTGSFDPNAYISAQAYYKVMLEVLGFSQVTPTNPDGDFKWSEVFEFALSIGLLKVADVKDFTVNDVATATVEALQANDGALTENLIEKGIIDKDDAETVGLIKGVKLEVLYQKSHEGRIQSVAFSPDGQIAVAGTYIMANLYSATDGDHIRTIDTRHTVQSMDFSPDGTILGAGQGAYGVYLYDVAGIAEPRQLHGGYEGLVVFLPDGKRVATTARSFDAAVWVWNIEDGEQLTTFEPDDKSSRGLDNPISDMALSEDGKYLATISLDNSLRLWDIESGEHLYTIDKGYGSSNVAISPDGGIIAVDSLREVHLLNLEDGSLVRKISLGGIVRAIDFSPDGKYFVTGDQDGIVSLWRTSDWSLQSSIQFEAEEGNVWLTAVAFSDDSDKIAAGTWNGYFYVLEIK